MRRSARTDLCGGRSVMIVPTASMLDGSFLACIFARRIVVADHSPYDLSVLQNCLRWDTQ
jgi:hypothetical protein